MSKSRKSWLRIAILAFLALFLASCLVGFAACGGDEPEEGGGVHTTHTWDGGTVTKQATCTAAGETTYTCTVCGETKTETISALGHDWGSDKVTAPTCKEGGYTTQTCSRCGATQQINLTDKASDHKWGEGVETTAATCTETGVTTYTCTICGETKTETIAALGHTLVKTEATAATCTEAGNNEYWTCSVCEKVFSDESGTTETTAADQTIAATGEHTYEPKYDATSGIWQNVCSVCSDTAEITDGTGLTLTVSSEAELRAGIAINNVTVKLADNINLTSGCLSFYNSLTLDLNGKTLDIDSDATSYGSDRVLDFELDNISGVTEDNPIELVITSSSDTMGKIDVCSRSYGFVIFGSSDSSNAGKKLAKISMSNVEIVAGESNVAYAISTNGTRKYGMDTIEIEGCKISCKSYVAMYVPALDFKITDSTICGKTGIEIRGGSLEISGCTIVGTGDANVDWDGDIHNGAISTGYAISLTHPDGASGYSDITSVSVSDSTLVGSVYYNEEIITDIDAILTLEDVTIVVSTETQLRWAITVDGATVMLGDDIALAEGMLDFKNSLTLDLNGKTLSVSEDAVTNGWDRVLNFNLNSLTGVTADNPIVITITSSAETMGKIDVGSLSYGFVIMGSQDSSLEGSKLAKISIGNVEIVAGESNEAYAISTNGLYKYGMDTIEIDGCTITSQMGLGIYIPALDFEIKGSIIAGVTGIEIRGGSLKISGSLVIGTGDENVDWSGDIHNGAISTGYSISLTNPSTASNYEDITSVEITGCALLGNVYGDKDSEGSVLSIENTTIYTCDDSTDEDDGGDGDDEEPDDENP